MKRSLKVLTFLLIGLFLLVSGLNAALDHCARSTTQNTFTWYDQKGEVVLAYSGDLNYCKVYSKPVVPVPAILHRTSSPGASVPSEPSYGWL